MDASTVDVVLNAITTVGFPIVSCIALFYLLWKENKEHKAESEKWIQALDQNTAVIEKLMDKLDG